MNEQEFMRRMKNKGTRLTDQQMKNEYRNYLKNPDSFEDLAADNKSDPFLEGLAGTAGPDAGTVKAAVKPSAGQAAIKQRYMQDETIEPKPKITLPTINKAQRINTVLGLGDAASFPQELAEAKREADARAKAEKQAKTKQPYMQDDTIDNAFLDGLDGSITSAGAGDQQNTTINKPDDSIKSTDGTIDFEYWGKVEQFNKKRKDILFDTSLTKEDKDKEIRKLRDELLFAHEGQTLNMNNTPMQKKAEQDVNAWLDQLKNKRFVNTYMDDLERQEQEILGSQDGKNVSVDLMNFLVNIIPAIATSTGKGNMPNWAYYSKLALDTLGNYSSSPMLINTPLQPDAEYYKKLATVQAKKDYLNSSPYRNIVFSKDEPFSPFSSTNQYKEELDKYIKDIESGKKFIKAPGLGMKENEEYRNRYIGYLKDVLYMNQHPEEYIGKLQQEYGNIDKSHTK